MYDLAWNDNEHYLAEAETRDGHLVVMLAEDCNGDILVSVEGETEVCSPDGLIPTGRKWHLTPPNDNSGEAHPDTLTTEHDYEQARQVEVILPRPSDDWFDRIPGTRLSQDCDRDGNVELHEQTGGYITIAPHELQPLALALLALHHKETPNG